MNRHLREISSQVTPGAHGVRVLDGAGWHQTGGRLEIPDNISLLHLPPYSPELNPVENIWQYLRQNYLSNRIYENYDAILDACCEAWNSLIATPTAIRSIATREWTKTINGWGCWYHSNLLQLPERGQFAVLPDRRNRFESL
jgi:transposase